MDYHKGSSSENTLKKTLIICVVAAYNLIMFPLMGQINCKLTHYTGEDGISHGSITAILKDCDGFLWLGTWNGLNRFDGRHFKTYKSSVQNGSYLESERIVQLEETAGQLLWIRTYDAQVYFFDKKTEQFTSASAVLTEKFGRKIAVTKIFKLDDNQIYLAAEDDGLYKCINLKSGKPDYIHIDSTQSASIRLSANRVNFMHRDRANNIWVGTQHGLSGIRTDLTAIIEDHDSIGKTTKELNIIEVQEDEHQLYFSTTNGVLLIYNKQTYSFKKITVSVDGINRILLSNDKKQLYISGPKGTLRAYKIYENSLVLLKQFDEEIQRLYEDKSGNIWLEPQGAGAILWDRVLDRVKHFQSTFGRYESNVPFRCFEDRHGLLWITLRGGGFGHYDASTGQLITQNQDDFGNLISFPQQVYLSFYDDEIFWISSEEKGLIKLHVREASSNKGNLRRLLQASGDPEVRSLLYDRKGRLWIGTKGGRLVIKEGDSHHEAPIVDMPADGFSGIYSLIEDTQGRIWIATKSKGVYVASPLENDRSRYRIKNFHQKNSKLPLDNVYAILMDDQGDIWLGTFGAGLVKVINKQQHIDFDPVPFRSRAYSDGSFDKIRHLSTDKEGNIWIATTYGLLIYDRKGRFRAIKGHSQQHNKIDANDLQYIFRKSNGEMWICTSGGGVSKAVGAPFGKLKFETFSIDKGLSNDYVLSGIEDAEGNLWFATEGGISKYDTNTNYFFSFDSFHDRTRFSFAEKTVVKTAFGEIVWGTNKGIIAISPATLSMGKGSAKLVFSHLWINNKEMVPNPWIKGQQHHVQYADRLILRHNENNISIDFTIVDYKHDHQTFLYRLKGLDSDTTWHSNQHLNRVTFTNLQPGNYLFEVKGHSDLYETAPYKQLMIIVSPPWWKTWWAYIIYTVLFLSGIALAWRVLSTMLTLKNRIEVEKRVSTLKMTFFTNVSHELRTPLTLILSPVKQLLTDKNLSGEGREYVHMIQRNATRMESFVNQLLDLRKVQENKFNLSIKSVDLILLLQEVMESFLPLARERGMTLLRSFPANNLMIEADEDQLATVFMNILSNAFKYSPDGTTITLALTEEPKKNQVTVSITDQGKGVHPESLKNIFELFYRDPSEAASLRKGSGIGLALTKELVELHHGHIRAYNNTDKGLTVDVTLPKTRRGAAYKEHMPITDTSTESPVSTRTLPDTEPASTEKPLVLIVEDNKDLVSFLNLQLRHDYDLLSASDGWLGLKLAKAHLPDLIISDIMMPIMDGINMLNHIRENVSTSHIPVVLLSAKHAIENQIEGMKYGADYYITKPFDVTFLLSSMENLLRRRKQFFKTLVEKREVLLKPSDLVITDMDEEFLQDVIRVVEQKMSDPEFNIDMVADQLNLGRSTFYKKFKSLTKLTPVEFVRDMRLQRAHQLLNDNLQNIAQVAYMVGFNNPKYFSTCFKDKYGVSPKEFSKSGQET